MAHKYDFNESFFENIDTQEKAYCLGFLYADGSITKRTVKIVQRKLDGDIILKFRDVIGSNHKIKKFTNVGEIKGNVETLEYCIYSTKMVNDLINNGCFINKSMKIRFPFFINEELYPHFIRGYFDGDGCVWNGKRKKMLVKDSKHKNGERVRIVHNVKFHITSNKNFIEDLQGLLIDKLGFSESKLTYRFKNKSPEVCTMEYCGRKNLKKFYDYIYKDATIFGERKRKKFDEIFCALSEKSLCELGLIAGKPLETQEPPIDGTLDNAKGMVKDLSIGQPNKGSRTSYDEGSSTITEM